jgi:hypothetical protein
VAGFRTLLDLAQLDPFLAVLHMGNMRADQLSDFMAFVLRGFIKIDKHEFGHDSGVWRVGQTSAVLASKLVGAISATW